MSIPLRRPDDENGAKEEVPQELRMLRQLGDYAMMEIILPNPFFRKFGIGELKAEERKMLREQSGFLKPHFRELAKISIEEALKAKNHELSGVLQQTSLYCMPGTDAEEASGASFSRNPDLVVHPATRSLLGTVKELSGRKNYIQLAAAVYALMRMAPAERLIMRHPRPAERIREEVRGKLTSEGAVSAQETPASSNLSALLNMSPGLDRYDLENHLIAGLEEALRTYVSGRATFKEGIHKGIETIAKAKRKFYVGLATGADGFAEDEAHSAQRATASNSDEDYS